MNKDGLMSHETYQEMEKACNREDGIEAGVLQTTKANVREPGQVIVFTPEQIEDFCKSAKQLCEYNKMPSLVVSLQIIKQLQEERQDLRFELSDSSSRIRGLGAWMTHCK